MALQRASSSARLTSAPRAGGYSLLEMVIVLALVAAVAALAWPRLGPLLDRSRHREAALQLKTDLAEARYRAVESGNVWGLRYQAETGRYQIGPVLPQEAAPERRVGGRKPEVGNAATTSSWSDRELPGEVRFAMEPFSARRDPESIVPGPSENPPPSTTDAWTLAVVFEHTGRANSSDIRLVQAGTQSSVVLHVRGLTGSVTIGKVARSEKISAESVAIPPEDVSK